MSPVSRWRKDPKLEAVLVRLAEQLGDLWTTQAVKLPYLVDVVAARVLGRPVTRCRYEAWQMGVVATGAWALMKHDAGGKYFQVCGDPVADGLLLHLEPGQQVPQALASEELAIVDFIAKEYGHLSPTKLGALTKTLNPGVENWGSNAEVEPSEDAYARLAPGWQRAVASLQQADLTDATGWEGPIGDVAGYLRQRLAGDA